MRLAFAGTPEVALPTLRALLDSPRHEVVAVITRPAAPAGRGRHETAAPVAALAHDAGLPVLTPQRAGDPDFLATLAELSVDCCPVVAYGALLPPAALAVPARGWVNLHFSLLPAWRGAAPVQHAVLHGDEVTGASTFLIEAGLDTGPVYGVVTEAIRPADTAGDLLRTAGGQRRRADVRDDGRHRRRHARRGAAARRRGLAGTEARPSTTPGSTGPRPAGTSTDWCGPARRRRGPGRRSAASGSSSARCGCAAATSSPPVELAAAKSGVAVGTATLDVELGLVQPPGSKPMPAADWARGARPEPGERLG